MADAAEWKSGLPEELKSAPDLKDVPDVATLAKRFIDTKAFVGQSLRPPGADAGPEARMEFIAKLREKVPELMLIPDGDDDAAKLARESAWQRLGRPKEAKEYAPPADVQLADEHLEALRKEALDEGLTKGQFAARAKRIAEGFATAALARKEATAALKKELGPAFDERTANAAALAAKLGFPQSLVSDLKSGAVDASTFKAFDLITKGFGQTAQVATQTGGRTGALTPSEALAQRDEIMSRSQYFRPKANEMGIHRSLVARVQELNEIIAQAEAA